jgi:hypothetical protein
MRRGMSTREVQLIKQHACTDGFRISFIRWPAGHRSTAMLQPALPADIQQSHKLAFISEGLHDTLHDGNRKRPLPSSLQWIWGPIHESVHSPPTDAPPFNLTCLSVRRALSSSSDLPDCNIISVISVVHNMTLFR